MNTVFKKTIEDTNELNFLAEELIRFAGELKIWGFYGDMGAGKTTFIKHICKYLGVKENVSSPTFSLINEYRNQSGSPVFHFDFYRIKNEKEAVDIGCEEYFERDSLCLIEWPEKILNLLPHPMVKIIINVTGKKRTFTFCYD